MKGDSSNNIMVLLKDLRGITRENKIGDTGERGMAERYKKEIYV